MVSCFFASRSCFKQKYVYIYIYRYIFICIHMWCWVCVFAYGWVCCVCGVCLTSMRSVWGQWRWSHVIGCVALVVVCVPRVMIHGVETVGSILKKSAQDIPLSQRIWQFYGCGTNFKYDLYDVSLLVFTNSVYDRLNVETGNDGEAVLWMSLLVSVTSQIIERGSPSCLVFAQCSECQSGEANDWRNREHVVLDLFSNLKMGKILWKLWFISRASDNYVDQSW